MTSLVAVDVLQVSVSLTESSIAPNERSRNRFGGAVGEKSECMALR